MNKIKNNLKEHKGALIFLITVCVVILLVVLRFSQGYFMGLMRAKMMEMSKYPKATSVSVGDAQVTENFESAGRIQAQYTVELVARVPGYIQQTHFVEGDFVKKGQVLFTIEDREYINALNEAQAELKSAKAQLAKAEVDFKRADELVKKDYISKATYDDRLAQRDISRANVQRASARVDDARRNLSYTKITSPINGRIGAIIINNGNYVTPQSGALAKIASTDPIYALYSLDSKQFNELRGNNVITKSSTPFKAELELADGTIYKELGTQDFYDNEISEATGAISLRATFKNPNNVLIPGDFVKVRVFSNTSKTRTIVPQAAVLQDSAGKYVFKFQPDKKTGKYIALQTRITTNGQFENNWIVESGLTKGEMIIKDGVLKLYDKAIFDLVSKEEFNADTEENEVEE